MPSTGKPATEMLILYFVSQVNLEVVRRGPQKLSMENQTIFCEEFLEYASMWSCAISHGLMWVSRGLAGKGRVMSDLKGTSVKLPVFLPVQM